MIEGDYQRELLLQAPYLLTDRRLFRRQIMAIKVENRTMRAGIRGQCDLYMLIRGGRHVEIELKNKTARLTEYQIAWQGWCLTMQIPHTVLRTSRDETVQQTISRWLTELARM